MSHNRQKITGLVLIAVGLIVVAMGAFLAPSNLGVALYALLALPLLVSLCGCVVAFVALARTPEKLNQAKIVRRIIGLAAIVGLALGLGFPAARTVSQLTDWLSGQNGAYIASSTPGLVSLGLGGSGLLTGVAVGIVVALIWWAMRGRHVPADAVTHS